MHRAGQIRIVELVGVANSLVWYQFEILPAQSLGQEDPRDSVSGLTPGDFRPCIYDDTHAIG